VAKYRRICLAVTLMLGASLAPALAQEDDNRPAADDPAWSLCADTASKVEADLGLPAHILTAVSLAETGRAGPSHQVATWPWTVHDGTKGYHFATQKEAVDFVRDVRTDGRRSIDVGCMQVNLYHHPRAFTSVSEGFDPEANIRYAAGFLKDLAATSRSWEEAIAKYHTLNPTIDEEYAPRVLAFWARERARAVYSQNSSNDTHTHMRLASAHMLPEQAEPARLVLASASSPETSLGASSLGTKMAAVAPLGAANQAPLVLQRRFSSAP
jgi:Transglycosylase SLT domain